MKIGFIGCGKMGGALVKAVAKAMPAWHITIAEKDEARAAAFAAETGVMMGSNAEVAQDSRYLFLAVKPQMLEAVMAELQPVLAARSDEFVLVSMAAGIRTEKVQTLSGGKYPVIRIMPNLPVSVGEGMILYTATPEVSEEALDGFLSLMQGAGMLTPLEEDLIDAGTSVSGCGPAFACMFLTSLTEGGVACGLSREKARLLAEQTLLGTAKLLLTTKGDPTELRDAVCSPGGSTIEGVRSLQNGDFEAEVEAAVMASYRRNIELGK